MFFGNEQGTAKTGRPEVKLVLTRDPSRYSFRARSRSGQTFYGTSHCTSRCKPGNATIEENSMSKHLMMSVAAAALIAGAGLAQAQNAGAGMSREAPAAGTAQRAAPSAAPADRAAPMERSAPTNRDEANDTAKRPEAGAETRSSQSDDKMQRDNGGQRASDSARDAKQPSSAQTGEKTDPKAGKDMKADRTGNTPDNKAAADSKASTTTGQAGAGAKLSTEQRTTITTTIKQQNIKPVTNINFTVSVGTRVPRDVGFHPLPTEIITVYPDWRGYEFFLVRDEIIVVNPRTLEIVAVLPA
ncbi:DUF1236 domain-containing protein [Tardiphaga sp.]|uniref:DUF1236 domain-containing protein n=1 Tax=Tardiphaga sp. TaxID=1926292 RepID=UPI00344E6E1C